MTIRYTRKALMHLSAIRADTEQRWPGTNNKVGQHIRTAIARLADFPEMGRQGRVPGTRELVIPRLPFIVAYRVRGSHVEVLAILHGTRRWPPSFGSG